LTEPLIAAVATLRTRALSLERSHAKDIERVHPSHRESARNLLHYLALRQSDNRTLQQELAELGLSSLGRAEAHTLHNLDSVLRALRALAGLDDADAGSAVAPMDLRSGAQHLHEHTRRLLGLPSGKRTARIMVTMPSAAASDPGLVHALLAAGMDIMRINCAHDHPEAWLAMISNLRAAEQSLGRSCRIYADLAGPKLRTGPIRSSGRLAEFGPTRDARGAVVARACIWLTSKSAPEAPATGVDAVLPVDDALLAQARIGDAFVLDDCRGGERSCDITEQHARSFLATASRHVFVEEGADATLRRDYTDIARGRVGPLREVILPIMLRPGDQLRITTEPREGTPAQFDDTGRMLEPACISCTLPTVVGAARPGHRVWLDDGKIGGRIVARDESGLTVEVTHALPRGSKLRPEKGINLPDTDLPVPALTDEDREHLRLLTPQVDLVGLSFVRRPQDVVELQQQLQLLGAAHLGTVLKIETRQAFENLPRLLLASLRVPPVGVMVARGDLAVEVGFERLAEVQEEILWLCEAAHVPVIWATQVLERMAKKGMPSRAEVSDAAMSVRAECVMLNKGPFVVETVRFLNGVLERMSNHVTKRRSLLRRLAVSDLAPLLEQTG
jgi:pyruvate kinase